METWLTDKHLSTEYFPNDFEIYRCDRSGNKKGGGIVILIRKSLCKSERIVIDCDIDIEYICLKLYNRNSFVYVYALYVPPMNTDEQTKRIIYEKHVEMLDRIDKNDNDSILVIGDFNLPKIKWYRMDEEDSFVFPYYYPNSLSSDILSGYFSEGLSQLNYLQNASNNILDLCFTSDPDIMDLIEVKDSLCTPTDIFHATFVVQMYLFCEKSSNYSDPNDYGHFYDFKNAPINDMCNYLSSIDYEFLFLNRDIDDAMDDFYEILKNMCDLFIIKVKDRAKKALPWENNKDLINLKNRKRKIKNRLVRSFSNDLNEAYRLICKEYEDKYKQCYNIYLIGVQNDFRKNPKNFWKYVDMKRTDNSVPSEMKWLDQKATNEYEKACLFASFFDSVYTKNMTNTEHSYEVDNDSTETEYMNITDTTIEYVLNKLNTAKGKGPDLLPPSIYKDCASALIKPIKLLIEKSLNEGKFPEKLKVAYVTPIFKSGNRRDVANYRSVSVVSTLARIFENVILDRFANNLTRSISQEQHGFVKNRSTVTNLIETTTYIAEALERRSQIDVIYLDFEKAFDSVNHLILLEKIKNIGIPKKLLSWIKSFLIHRKCYVKVKNAMSTEYSPTSGVPAGCSFSSFLFNIFIDDITRLQIQTRNIKFKLFADDVKILGEIKSESDYERMQEVLIEIEKWSVSNRLKMNVKKVKLLRISRSLTENNSIYRYADIDIERVGFQRDLGVIFDSKFGFEKHIETISKKAFVSLGFVKRFSKGFSFLSRKTLFASLVRPQVEYAMQVWAPHQAKYDLMIEKVQKKFTIWALNLARDPVTFKYMPYENRLKLVGFEKLSKRRAIAAALWLYDIITGRIDSVELREKIVFNRNIRNTRTNELLHTNLYRSNYLKYQPMERMIAFFNKVRAIYESSKTRNEFKNNMIKCSKEIIDMY